jgi:23S rRNA (guanosine2251-2'-O)-methyltransferase
MRREWSSKTRKKELPGRSRSPEEWVYGLNPVLETLRGGRTISAVYLSSSRRQKVTEIVEALAKRGMQAQKVDESFFEERFVKGHQGIAARVMSREYADLEDLLRIPEQKRQMSLFLLLDGIEDPRNFGSILRVADAGGVHGVVIQSHRSALLTSEAVKASAGASEYVQISMVPNIKHAMRAMKDSGVAVLGAEAAGDVTVWETDLTGPVALVIGSEAEGMRRTVKEHCDRLVRLPMQGRVNSLNVSVATGIIIFEIMRQRSSKL